MRSMSLLATPAPTPVPPGELVWGCCEVSTSAVATPSSVHAGSETASIVTTITLGKSATVIVDIEVYDSDGSLVLQKFYLTELFAAGESRQYTNPYSPAENAIGGTYRVATGIFAPGWGNLLDWSNPAGTFAVTATAAPTAVPTPFTAPSTIAPSLALLSPLHVSGNSLVNSSGASVQLVGVNRSGSEYACIQGWGFFDGPTDDASLQAIRAWGANSVRVPLNEGCWLGINGAPAQFSGRAYQEQIADYVTRLGQNRLYAVLELHWSAPGIGKATGQRPMPDADHSVTFWNQVATTFKGNGTVIFDLFNEPFPDNQQDSAAAWTCWRDGGTCSGFTFKAAGMQSLVSAVRSTGATNVIALSGVSYANSLVGWLAHKPADPQNNLVAAWHVYDFNVCHTTSCFDSTVGPVAQSVPVIALEFGSSSCNGTWLAAAMGWFDTHGLGYAAWTWNTWGTSCSTLSLITSFAGTPTTWGQIFQTQLAKKTSPAAPSPISTVAPSPVPTSVPQTPSLVPTAAPQPTAVPVATPSLGPVVPVSQPTGFPVSVAQPMASPGVMPTAVPAAVQGPGLAVPVPVRLPQEVTMANPATAGQLTPGRTDATNEARAAELAASSQVQPAVTNNGPVDGLRVVGEAVGEMIGVLTRESPYAGESLTQLVGAERAPEIMRVLAAFGDGIRARSAAENGLLALILAVAVGAGVIAARRMLARLRRGLRAFEGSGLTLVRTRQTGV
jgi:endoglucanase